MVIGVKSSHCEVVSLGFQGCLHSTMMQKISFSAVHTVRSEVKVNTYIHKDTTFSDIVLKGILYHTVILTKFGSGGKASDLYS
jgi:hypothetical protein